MSIRQFPGGIITKSPTAPTTSAAKGIWTLDQVTNYVKQGIWPATPGTPTIGTATATGSTTATVAFTAPTNLGSGTVTYTATSSPSGITGTGASSPITVSGLTASTSYTFTVTASTPGGTSAASAASNSITTSMAPGTAYGGGYFAGQIDQSGTIYNLVIGPKASTQFDTKQWKNANTATPGADSDIDGPQNTTDAVADGSATVYVCAHLCNNLVVGGFSDWYMPAKNELEVCYYNLKPTTTSNYTSSGINPNAVPARTSNYTAGDPARTSSAIFQEGNAEAFFDQYWWSSTEASATNAWEQRFGNGRQYSAQKTNSRYVRAVRRVLA